LPNPYNTKIHMKVDVFFYCVRSLLQVPLDLMHIHTRLWFIILVTKLKDCFTVTCREKGLFWHQF